MKQSARQAVLATALTILGVVGLWYLAIFALHLKPYIMPTPGAVWTALLGQHEVLLAQLGKTLVTGLIGIVVSTSLAFATAAVLAANPRLTGMLMPYLVAVKGTPVVALAPLVMLFLGRGIATGIVVVVIVSFLPMLVNCLQGFSASNRRHLELMHLCGASSRQVFWLVRLPFATPFVFAGLRAAVPAAVLGALLAEWLTGAKGIGSYILELSSEREMEALWAGIVLCMVTSMLLFWAVVGAERLVARRLSTH